MTFLNWPILAALAAVAIPILIHLLNRRQAKVVDWGAMQFLLASLASRNRRILLEEVVLMVARCVLVALLVLALARPFVPSRSALRWALVLPAVLGAAACAGAGAALWSRRKLRWALWAVAGAMVAGAVGASLAEQYLQRGLWAAGGGERDVAIVIDGSASMTLGADGRDNFSRAAEEAAAAIDACGPGDAFSVILAGAAPRAVLAAPTGDRRAVREAMQALRPAGGAMRVLDALNAAAACLAQGHNAAKKVLLLTDGQSARWDLSEESRWRFLAGSLRNLPAGAEIICRTLPLPEKVRNAAVAELRLSREVVGMDRPVSIDVKVTNTGTSALRVDGVLLEVDGTSLGRMSTSEIPPNASETVRYSHRFDAAGQHVLRARLLGKDDMPWDDEAQRVVSVIESLPVLIVEGRSSSQAFGGAAAFVELALAPREGPSDAPPATPPKAPEGAAGSDASREPPCLVSPTIVPAADFKPDEHLRGCRLVVLADVPKLPAAAMEALADFVHAGGGLLIAPGQEARRESHAIWPTRAGANLLPAVLDRRNTVQVTPVRPALKTFTHPALELLASSSGSDAESCLVKSYWRLAADEKDPAVRVGGLLETGEPLLVERKFGRGAVILIALALDRRDSNLPSLKCFVPLVHELAYYLAAATVQQANVKPGGELVLELPEIKDGAAAAAAARASPPASDQAVEVLCPSGRRLPGAMAVRDGRLRLTFARTDEPGLHRFDLPAELCRRYVQPTAGVATGLPFVVLPDAEESRLDGLDAGDFDRLNGFVPIRRAQTPQELTAALTGDVPGEELWRYAAVAALLALLGEVALTRWIALRRRSHQVETVEFGQGAVDVDPHKPAARRAPQDRTDRNVERVAPT